MNRRWHVVLLVLLTACNKTGNHEMSAKADVECEEKRTLSLDSTSPINDICHAKMKIGNACAAMESKEIVLEMVSLPTDGKCEVQENWTRLWLQKDFQPFASDPVLMKKLLTGIQSEEFESSLGFLSPEARKAFEQEGITSADLVGDSGSGGQQSWSIPLAMKSCMCAIDLRFGFDSGGYSHVVETGEVVID